MRKSKFISCSIKINDKKKKLMRDNINDEKRTLKKRIIKEKKNKAWQP